MTIRDAQKLAWGRKEEQPILSRMALRLAADEVCEASIKALEPKIDGYLENQAAWVEATRQYQELKDKLA